MIPEVASGMIETRHIVTPVRTFCKKAKFYEANVQSIDLDNKQVDSETHYWQTIFSNQADLHQHSLKYDY